MSLKDELLPLVDELKAIPGELGFRPYQVWVRTVESAGSRSGIGARTLSETRLLVGGQDPKVREVKREDVTAGNKAHLEAEYDIGPLTPEFAGGGVAEDTINPQQTGTPAQVFFVLKGPGLPTSGLLCRRVSDKMDRPLRIVVRVKGIGREA